MKENWRRVAAADPGEPLEKAAGDMGLMGLGIVGSSGKT
jgi:hypothetical protein